MAKKENTPLKKGQAKFQLIGEAKLTDFTYKIDEESQKSDWIYNVLNLGVDCGGGNVVYADMMGGYGAERDNVLYVHGVKDGDNGRQQDDWSNRFTIAWEDREDEDILETIGNQCFFTVGLEKDKKGKTFAKKFISQYDAIQYIQEHLEDGMVINVKGDLKYSIYNETVQIKKEITSVFLSRVDDPANYKATFTQTVLLDKDSVGKVNKEKASYPIYAKVVDYTKMYGDKEVKQNITFDIVLELEVDKAKPENTKKFIDKVLKVKKDVSEVSLEGDLVEGQSLVNITEDDIPDDIKELIDIGAYTLEDAISKMAVGNGSKEKRMIVRKPSIKMVGDDEDKKPVIQKRDNAYKIEDFMFDFMFEDEDADTDDDTPPFDVESEDAKEADDMSWLDALGDDE